MVTRTMFPSPIGVLYISIIENKNPCNSYRFSVPYWGSLYFNEILHKLWLLDFWFSVPYWGSLYFNPQKYYLFSSVGTGFRPLLGFFLFQTLAKWHNASFEIVSVPYWGSFYFKQIQRRIYQTHTVSVPYWGSLYFNEVDDMKKQLSECFRPLLGFFIFQSCPLQPL